MVRMVYILPFLYAVAFALSVTLLFRKLKLAYAAVLILTVSLIIYEQNESFYKTSPQKEYASFDDYYVPYIFKQIKNKIGEKRVVSYGIEPAVALYNDIYTVDGYSVNYPLSYKHRFEKVFETYKNEKLYEKWGSKVYIPTIKSTLASYQKGLHIKTIRFNVDALCKLHTSYVISPYFIEHSENYGLSMENYYKGKKNAWDIYLYKIRCQN